jgi:histidyl-tRNA synthetase
MRLAGKLPVARKSPADVMVVLRDEGRPQETDARSEEDKKRRATAAAAAQMLRERGLKVEMYHAVRKLSDQIKYAERKGIPYVWLPPVQDGGTHEVKNMSERSQGPADPQTWSPDKGTAL